MKKTTQIGEWVKSVRAATGLSQDAFAAKIGVHRTTLADWERGKNEPELKQVRNIVKLFPNWPMPPFGPQQQNDTGPLLPLEEALTAALERRAARITGLEYSRAQRRIGERAHKLSSAFKGLDEQQADQLLDVLIEIPERKP